MASSGTLSKSFDDGKYVLEIVWWISKRDSTNYTSEISWKAYFTNNTSSSITIKRGDITCRQFGVYYIESLNSSMPRTFYNNTRTVIERNSLTHTDTYKNVISHNADGTASPSIVYNINYADGGKSFNLSESITLDPFDKRIQASLSTDNISVGETLEITTSYSPSCAFELIASIGGLTEKIAEGTGAQTVNWTVPNSFRSVVSPATRTGICTIECKTYHVKTRVNTDEETGEQTETKTYTYIGSRTYMLTLRISETDEPDAEITVKAVSRITNENMSEIYLAGYTYLVITNKCTAKNGATIQSVVTTVYGQSYTGNNVTTNVIPRAANGSIPISIKVTDSNGLSATFVKHIEITAYKPPCIENFAIHRCKSDGTLDDEGGCCFVEYEFSVDALVEYIENRNTLRSASISVQQVKANDTEEDYPIDEYFINCESLLSYEGSMIIENVNTEACFDITLTVEDRVTNVPVLETLSTAVTVVDIYKDGTGIAFGKVAEHPNLYEFDRPVKFNKNFQCTEEWIEENVISSIDAYFGYEEYNDILGLRADYENKKFTRLAAAAGKTAGADFDDFLMYGGMKRCNVNNNGEIIAYYGDANFIDNDSSIQVMVYVPKFYYRVVPLKLDKNTNGLGYHIRKADYYISATQKTGFKLHSAFYDENGNEVDYFLYSAYEGALYRAGKSTVYNDAVHTSTVLNDNDLILSRYNTKPISGQNLAITRPLAEKYCSNRGTGWHCETIQALSALKLLMMIEYGTMNLQTAFSKGVSVYGKGESDGVNYAAITGSTRSLGNQSGEAAATYFQYYDKEQEKTVTEHLSDTQKVSCSYRGIENPYGNLWRYIQGINVWGDETMAGGQPYICNDFNYNELVHSDNYKSAGFTVANETGYINAMGYGLKEYDWLLIPSEIGGTSALPVGDYWYVSPNANGHRIVRHGGAWNYSVQTGMFSGTSNTIYTAYGVTTGCRLIYVPTVE